MTAAPATRVGWCPGALRPMQTGDGLVLRIKPRMGVLTLKQAGTVAALGQRFGNGNLDLTGRANMQIRGVSADTFDPLIEGLRKTELLDASSEAEAVRNVVTSPLAGIDRSGPFDIRPTVATLEARLAADAELQSLAAKWSVVVDQGGQLTLAGIAADLRFEATLGGGFHVGLAGDPLRAFCEPDAVADIAAALCRQALSPRPSRMAEIVTMRGAAAVFAAAGLSITQHKPGPRAPTIASDAVGRHRFADQVVLGLGAPFGALKAEELGHLVELAQVTGATGIRLTPWRVLLLTGLNEASASRISKAVGEHRMIVDPADPRLSMAACSGAPACPRATTPVRRHAELLAGTLASPPQGIAVHISGCAKGCAHPGPAPWTLVGREGRYDLVRHGGAGDTPIARGLTFQQAATWISRDGNPGRP